MSRAVSFSLVISTARYINKNKRKKSIDVRVYAYAQTHTHTHTHATYRTFCIPGVIVIYASWLPFWQASEDLAKTHDRTDAGSDSKKGGSSNAPGPPVS